MLVSDEKKFVFVHIQKTGGMSLSALLREHVPDARLVCGRHEHLRRAPPELAEQWRGYFKFCFVRNPWDRLLSWYAMIQREYRRLRWWQRAFRKKPLPREIWNLAVPYLDDFGRFVRDCTGEVFDEGCLKSFSYNQCDYMDDAAGACGVDFVGRYEDLEADADRVLGRLDLAGIPLPHHNRSRHAHRSMYYDAATRAIVEERFHRDIARFGYRFEGES